MILWRHLHSYETVQLWYLNALFYEIQATEWKPVDITVTENLVCLKSYGPNSSSLPETFKSSMNLFSRENQECWNNFTNRKLLKNFLIQVHCSCFWWMPSACIGHNTPTVPTFMGFMSYCSFHVTCKRHLIFQFIKLLLGDVIRT